MAQRQGALKQQERARQEKQREKDAIKAGRRHDKGPTAVVKPGEDPDIAGIIPGPQPPTTD